jgi:membrane-associated phospholipid phosphatase
MDMKRMIPAALAACVAAVLLCYFFIDKPVVFFAHAHGAREYALLHWFQKIPNVIQLLSPAAVLYLVYRLYKKSLSHFDRFILHAVVTLIGITVVKYPIKYFFARHWPSTFYKGNLSLLDDGVYGFAFFEVGKAFEALPSGNAAVIFGLAFIFWFYYPRWRWLGALLCLLSAVGVIGLYYHFVGDVVAGAFMGIAVGAAVLEVSTRRG